MTESQPQDHPRQADWWQPLPNGQAACNLCPIGCRLRDGVQGPCGTRANDNGVMVPLHYGEVVAGAVDPMEKKPLYHFHPGRGILSVAAPGCNLHCLFCQNWSISQGAESRTQTASPKDIVASAQESGAVGIAYTYSEPLVWYEFVIDTARLAHQAGLKNVIVTNGFLNPEPLAKILPFIDAANIDLKAMDDAFYRKVCKASLPPVLAAIEQTVAAGVHVEITNLIIPGHNDAPQQVAELVDYVAGLDRGKRPDGSRGQIPLHFSAYHPAWKMKAPPTPAATLSRAFKQAQEKLDWVYLGNMRLEEGRHSACPKCGETNIYRHATGVEILLAAGSSCYNCDHRLPFILTG